MSFNAQMARVDRPCARSPALTPLSASEERAAALAEQRAKENARTLAVAPKLTAICQAARPIDYQQRVDTVLARLLKDPALRQVTYTSTPYGSLVCGTNNALKWLWRVYRRATVCCLL